MYFSNKFKFDEPFDFELHHYDHQSPPPNLDRWGHPLRPQLLPEEDLIPMPFLYEEGLDFLDDFDGPEPSVHEMLEILADPP